MHKKLLLNNIFHFPNLWISQGKFTLWTDITPPYLGEIKTEFENTLACLSGAQMGSNHEKNGGRKSRDTLPLSSAILELGA